MRFKTKIDLEIELIDACEQPTLEWELELETRDWGIKGFDIRIPDQVLTYTVENPIDSTESERTRYLRGDSVRLIFDKPEAKSYSSLHPIRLEIWKGKPTLFFQL